MMFIIIEKQVNRSSSCFMKKLLFLFFLSLQLQLLAQYSDSIRLNDIRVLTSHNSYKKKPDPKVLAFLSRFKKRLSDDLDPKQLDYGHAMLSIQLDSFNIRGFELDVNYDPDGGHFEKRRVNLFVKGLNQQCKDSLYAKSGFKLLHIADVDYETNYVTFIQALQEIKEWSDRNPLHIPLFINIEIKKDNPGNYSRALRWLGFKKGISVNENLYLDLDKEILSVFSEDQLFTPKKLKGDYKDINERLNDSGWPSLNSCLGKVIFILDGEKGKMYSGENEFNAERPMFVYGDPTGINTAFVVINEPIGKEEEIRDLSEKFMVRTRTDAGTIEARNNDYARFNSAMESKAQIITTDYYQADLLLSDFYVALKKYEEMKYDCFILR